MIYGLFPLNAILINLAMPMFVIISGYLFQKQLEKGRFQTWKQMLTQKSKRILLPYFIFSFLFLATTGNIHKLSNIIVGTGFMHLWFLPMLMWCFVCTMLFYRLTIKIYSRTSYIFFYAGILIIIFYIYGLPEFIIPKIFTMHSLQHWFIWFWIGVGIARYNLSININSKRLIGAILVIGGFIGMLFKPIEFGEYDTAFTLYQTCILVGIWILLSTFELNFINNSRFMQLIDKTSFGIYIFHFWVGGYMVSNTAKAVFPLQSWLDSSPLFFPLCLVLICFTISMGLTLVIKNIKFTRNLL